MKCQVDPSKHKEGYNYDVFYPDRGGTVFHRLQLELCGVGDEDGSPLGSWVLLAGAAKKKTAHTTKNFMLAARLGQFQDCTSWGQRILRTPRLIAPSCPERPLPGRRNRSYPVAAIALPRRGKEHCHHIATIS